MARLSSYYTLCPLIDQQNLLGVETDSNPGCAIVTLGRNIVIRYKLQDLKQVSSWSTKERLTTQVIYDEISQSYVAVFNGKILRIWKENEENLDGVKKYKLSYPIFSILKLNNVPPILVAQNGATSSVEWALDNRKTWNSSGFLLPNEKLCNCQLVSVGNKIYLCALAQTENDYNYIIVNLKDSNYSEGQVKRIEFKKYSDKLVGHVIVQDGNDAHLLTLWSHGRLYSYPLITATQISVPGTLVSVITAVNTKHPVIMVALNETTIAMYGAAANEEGAVLVIYNIQFKLAQANQKLKLYTNDAKLWKIEDKLLLAANRHLAIAPYSLAPQRIETILGSAIHLKSNDSNDNDIVLVQESEIADWGTEIPNEYPRVSSDKELDQRVSKKLFTLLDEGMSDVMICNILIPELIEQNDKKSIIWCLNHLKNISEELLIQLLKFCLKDLESELASKILNIHFTDLPLISCLRTKLNFEEILKLFQYLIHNLDGAVTGKCDKKLYEWIALLIDSYYQHYLLSQDTLVLELFNKLNDAVNINLELMKDLENLRPILRRLLDGKPITLIPNDVCTFYSIEEMKLY